MPGSADSLTILGGYGGEGTPPPLAASPAGDDPLAAKMSILDQGIAGKLEKPPPQPTGSWVPRAFADIGPEIKNAASENISAINAGLNPFSEAYKQTHSLSSDLGSQWQQFKATGAGLAAIPGLVASPITGTTRSLIGHPFADVKHGVGMLLNPEEAAKDNPKELYQEGKNAADLAMMGIGARGGIRPPTTPPPTAPPEVLLTKGQETGDLGLIREEQAALRGQRGDPARQRAEAFAEQQGQQVQNVKERIGQSFDQFGQTIAQSPQDAAALAQGAIQRAAQTQKAGVNAAYGQARQLGGELNPSVFDNASGQIRANLSSRPDPVVIDDKLTPWASKALSEVDNVGNVQNRAAMPGTGVNLEGIDQARKRLVQYRTGAYANNATDGRAASAVLDAFDDHVTQAINSGAFRGNPQAVQAWNDARAASAQFKQTFSAVKGDSAGRKIEQIIGRRGNDPLTPNDVADALYGVSGTNPGTTNVGVANRVKNILGEQSPEWSAVKQGLWRRLTEKGEGQPEMEPGTIANRLMKFLNADGREMANAVYSPQERAAIRGFAELQRKLQPPPTTINRSETSTFVVPVLKKIASGVAYAIGGAIAHHIGFGMEGEVLGALATGKGASFVANTMNARQISAQMPLATEAADKFQKAVAAYNRANSPPSRVALSVATTNLVRAVKPLGVTFEGTLPATGSVPAAAGQQNP